jgi:hypothetical protein
MTELPYVTLNVTKLSLIPISKQGKSKILTDKENIYGASLLGFYSFSPPQTHINWSAE